MNRGYTSLTEQFLQVGRMTVRSQFSRREDDGPQGLEDRILAILKRKLEMEESELEYLLDAAPTAFGQAISRMEQSGLIDPTGGAPRVVRLTDKGRAAARESKSGDTHPFDCLTADEQETFRGYLVRISQALAADGGDGDFDEFKSHRGDGMPHAAWFMGLPFLGRRINRDFGDESFDLNDFDL